MTTKQSNKGLSRRQFATSIAGAAALSTIGAPALAIRAKPTTNIITDITAKTRTGGETNLSIKMMQELEKSMRGDLLMDGAAGYDSARQVWNGMIDKRPGLIARCTGAADVQRAVAFARSNDLLVAVRGGGHSVSGKSVCEGGLMIDTAPMKGVRVDPLAKTARLESGSLLGELDHEAQVYGLATPAGTVSHTGAAGLTLGGGHGRLGRSFGLTCDNVKSFEMIDATANSVACVPVKMMTFIGAFAVAAVTSALSHRSNITSTKSAQWCSQGN